MAQTLKPHHVTLPREICIIIFVMWLESINWWDIKNASSDFRSLLLACAPPKHSYARSSGAMAFAETLYDSFELQRWIIRKLPLVQDHFNNSWSYYGSWASLSKRNKRFAEGGVYFPRIDAEFPDWPRCGIFTRWRINFGRSPDFPAQQLERTFEGTSLQSLFLEPNKRLPDNDLHRTADTLMSMLKSLALWEQSACFWLLNQGRMTDEKMDELEACITAKHDATFAHGVVDKLILRYQYCLNEIISDPMTAEYLRRADAAVDMRSLECACPEAVKRFTWMWRHVRDKIDWLIEGYGPKKNRNCGKGKETEVMAVTAEVGKRQRVR